jgi:hypothetical protein
MPRKQPDRITRNLKALQLHSVARKRGLKAVCWSKWKNVSAAKDEVGDSGNQSAPIRTRDDQFGCVLQRKVLIKGSSRSTESALPLLAEVEDATFLVDFLTRKSYREHHSPGGLYIDLSLKVPTARENVFRHCLPGLLGLPPPQRLENLLMLPHRRIGPHAHFS